MYFRVILGKINPRLFKGELTSKPFLDKSPLESSQNDLE